MNYHFFLEYKNTTVSQKYAQPDETITSYSVDVASRKFCKKHKHRMSALDPLINGGHRLYTIYGKNEYAYYIEEEKNGL